MKQRVKESKSQRVKERLLMAIVKWQKSNNQIPIFKHEAKSFFGYLNSKFGI